MACFLVKPPSPPRHVPRFRMKKFHHVEFYCGDATAAASRFVWGLGMKLVAKSDQVRWVAHGGAFRGAVVDTVDAVDAPVLSYHTRTTCRPPPSPPRSLFPSVCFTCRRLYFLLCPSPPMMILWGNNRRSARNK